MVRVMRIALLFCTVVYGFAAMATPKNFFKDPFLMFKSGDAAFRNPKVTHRYGDGLSLSLTNKLKMEGLYTQNARKLNYCNGGLDETLTLGKFTWDLGFGHAHHNDACDWDTIVVQAGVRSKGVFGAPQESFKTGFSMIKDLDVVMGAHQHPINVQVLVLRELWGQFLVNEVFGLSFANPHTLTIGLFSFQLGRGIALGDAYAVSPDALGYDPESAVEQYAPGFKLSGSFNEDESLGYDLYFGVLSNRSASFSSVNERIRSQMFGHRYEQARDFGAINFVTAARLRAQLLDDACRQAYVEPYVLWDHQAEERIEMRGDAYANLGTFGVAFESAFGDFEFGFEAAGNWGSQHVRGIDRNIVQKQVRNGAVVEINAKIKEATQYDIATGKITYGDNALYLRGTANQNQVEKQIADALSPYAELEVFNGQGVPYTTGNVGGHPIDGKTEFYLQNADDRFRDPYKNTLSGAMFVCDASYYFRTPDVIGALTLAFVSGDENPNKDLDERNESSIDGNYGGFISLQELYSGRRVRSAFLLSGKGSIPRVLSFPVDRRVGGGTPSTVSRFTNLIYGGVGLWHERQVGSVLWKINPNVLPFWQDHKTRIAQVDNADIYASRFMGTEANVYIDGLVSKGLTFFAVLGIFFPGQHFEDISGRGLSADELKYLNSLDPTGADTAERVPLLGSDPAFFVNIGLDYRF
ncbi:MAG: hypothetical protein UV79_C0008G0008 [candidate division TM6 bacterium GW2011_GWF2_43_17]|nr:MAG: hypothetical protein UV79_C0008G0008 [candidate division TM6 bacterium GW2011_GWF2_43_17]